MLPVKVAEADTPAESVAVTVWGGQRRVLGTVKVADQVPLAATVMLLLADAHIRPVERDARAVVDRATTGEAGARDGHRRPPVSRSWVDKVMAARTAKVVDADTPAESVAVTVLEPLGTVLGTVKVADQVPLAATVTLLLPMLTFVPSNVTPELWLIVPPPVNPVPEMVTDVPLCRSWATE